MDRRLPRVLAGTTGLTGLLLLLGVYTAVSGSGLSCSAEWPLCSGGVLPHTLPSFIEWFHRLVAMVAGFVILGAAALTWRWGADRGVRAATALAVVLLPVQVFLGAQTVWVYGQFVTAVHFTTGLVIFGSLVAATALSVRGTPRARPATALRAALGLLALSVPVHPYLFVPFSEWVQFAYYGLAFAALAALCACALWATDRVRLAAGTAALLLGVVLLAARFVYTDLVVAVDLGGTLAVFALVAAAAWWTRDRPAGPLGTTA